MKPSQARGSTKLKLPVDDANHILGDLYGCIDSEVNRNFGSSMLRGLQRDIPNITIAHRILKKFEVPSKGKKDSLRKECFDQWIAYEELLRKFSFYDIPAESRGVLYRASALLHEWLIDFKPDRGLVEFTPGETFTSSNGRVSVFQKLSNKESWTSTPDCLDDFIRLCYNNCSLKRAAKAHMPKLSREQQHRLYDTLTRKGVSHIGYATFSFMMKTFVVTVVHGSRASTVAKNNSEDRFINVETLASMLLQRQVAQPIRHALARVGNDLELGQMVHKARISKPGLSTIDFSKASDSVLLDVVNRLFPKKVVNLLNRYRSQFVLIGDCYYEPVKLSSMGCGFTFEVMSALLLSIARVYDPEATVYGDDVIISSEHAYAFVEVANSIFFRVNEKKSFVDSPFRESCGAFYLDDYGYIKCFDLHFCETDADVVIATNKLALIIQDCEVKNYPLPGCYRKAYESLLAIIPPLYKGYTDSFTEPDLGFVYDPRARKKHMRSKDSINLRRRHDSVVSDLASLYGLNATDILVVESRKFKEAIASKSHREVADASTKLAHYLYSGRVAKDVIRNSGKWVAKILLVHPSFTCELRAAKLICEDVAKAETNRYNKWLETWSICNSGHLCPHYDPQGVS